MKDPAILIHAMAARLSCDPVIIAAILEVESNSRPFEARGRPTLRFEPLVFKKRTGREAADYAAATLLDPLGADEATSWGAPQIMGFHAAALGYADASAMRAAFATGFGEQLGAMERYCVLFGLVPALRARDMTEIARLYNGPAYARYGYHHKLAAACDRLSGRTDAPLRRGARGEEVRKLQEALRARGHDIAADGVFGAGTEAALISFQRGAGLTPDGVAGPRTLATLKARPRPWLWPLLAAVAGAISALIKSFVIK